MKKNITSGPDILFSLFEYKCGLSLFPIYQCVSRECDRDGISDLW